MTRDDIRKKLIYNQNQIGNIRTTINEQESQIENLEGLRNSFNRLLYDFNYKHNMQNARISDINNMSYINSKIVSSYTSAMHGVVNGSEYRKACNEIYRSIDSGVKRYGQVSKDGKVDIVDGASVGIYSATNGLSKLASSVTFGVVSFDGDKTAKELEDDVTNMVNSNSKLVQYIGNKNNPIVLRGLAAGCGAAELVGKK